MAKDKKQEAEYKAEGLRRMKIRKAQRLSNFTNNISSYPGSARYEKQVSMGLIQTCEWGNARCDLYGCNGDC